MTQYVQGLYNPQAWFHAVRHGRYLEALYLIVWYLAKKPVKMLVMDPTDVRMTEDAFHNLADSDKM